MNSNDIYNLLLKYADGEASAEEIIIIEKLINENSYWKNELEILRNLNCSIKNADYYKINPNTEQNWDKLITEIEENSASKSIKFVPNFIKYVAAAVIIFVAGWFLLKNNQNTNDFSQFSTGKIYKTGNNEMLDIVLDDGSKITLNENSELKIDKNFNINYRLTELKGEAYFIIAKDKSKPFIAKSNNTMVKVLGTVFKINSSNTQNIEVSLYEGKVKFIGANSNTILMPGKKVFYNVNTDKIETSDLLKTESKFWENKLIFKDEKLKEIVNRLEKRFNITIEIPEEIQNEKYTISFEGMNLDSCIKLLEELTDSKITKNDTKYLINP